jgi:hypothetical protein
MAATISLLACAGRVRTSDKVQQRGALKIFSNVTRERSDNAQCPHLWKVADMTLVMDETFAADSMEMSAAVAERRRGLRIRQARPIRVYEPSGARYFGGQTEDISATGLRIELPASVQLHPGKVVSIHVGMNRDGSILPNRKHMMPARVVWIDRAIAAEFAVVGVEFMASIAAHLDAA